jgi:hypothetical protein
MSRPIPKVAAHQGNKLERGFEVEWCSKLPVDEFGSSDFDRATMNCVDFATIEDARVFAKEIYPKDMIGEVRITEFEMVPYEPGLPGTYAEYIGESEYYSE